MPENLMSDSRHAELIKAAEETIGLMNIGVDGNAALSKVAQDQTMNDHEVEIVAHAVNNSKQLAHLQTAEPEDREKPFPLIDPDVVKNELQPPTNASTSVGDRYGPQDQPSQNAEDRAEQPDAVGIHKELLEKAAASSYEADELYLNGPSQVPDNLQVLRDDWGLQQEKVALAQMKPHEDQFRPFQKLSHYQIGIEEARVRYLTKVSQCIDELQALHTEMRRLDAPEWQEVEKVAHALGAESATLDLAYAAADIEKFGQARADLQVKTAGAIQTTQRVRELADKIVCADTLWKEASDIYAAQQELERQLDQAESGLCQTKQAAGEYPYSPKELAGGSIPVDLGQIAQEVEQAPRDYFTSPETLIEASGGEVDPKVEYRTMEDAFDQPFRQGMANTDTRARIEGLMEDDFIGGHSLPEVVEAYNAAMSVNPNFGQAELVSYMRQHLATEGAVPLDLQIRARDKGGKKD